MYERGIEEGNRERGERETEKKMKQTRDFVHKMNYFGKGKK